METDGDGIEVVWGRAGMEVKVDGDGWGWKQSLRGRVGLGVISVPLQVSNWDEVNSSELIRFWGQEVKGQGHIITVEASSTQHCCPVQLSSLGFGLLHKLQQSSYQVPVHDYLHAFLSLLYLCHVKV